MTFSLSLGQDVSNLNTSLAAFPQRNPTPSALSLPSWLKKICVAPEQKKSLHWPSSFRLDKTGALEQHFISYIKQPALLHNLALTPVIVLSPPDFLGRDRVPNQRSRWSWYSVIMKWSGLKYTHVLPQMDPKWISESTCFIFFWRLDILLDVKTL